MALPDVLSRPIMQPIQKLKGTAPTASTAAPACTHTFDAWRNFAVTYDAQRNVSGKYGVDFRFAPEPSGGERRTLKLLDAAAKCLGPRMLKRSAVQFDFIENSNARAQNNFYPCAQPSAHVSRVHPSTSQIHSHGQSQIQQTISTSSSATPRASPEQERPQPRLTQTHNQYQQQDPLHDTFFGFDLASPSEASAPPDTDGEQEHETEGTDTESERLSDLEGPVALRRRTIRRGRRRGVRRARRGSISATSTSSGPGASPVSPIAMRSAENVNTPFSYANANVSASALRPAYARCSSVSLPFSNQAVSQAPSQSQSISGISPHFPTSVSESGVSPGGGGVGYAAVSAAARGRMRGRGIGAPKSEPDPDITPTSTAGTSSGEPSDGNIQLRGDYNVGPYGYRYPTHPPYPTPTFGPSVSRMQSQAQSQGYAPPTGLDTVKEETHTAMLNWQTPTSTVGTGEGMDIDADLGGWGKVSEPPPGMELGYGMQHTSTHGNQSQTQTQSQMHGGGTYQNQAYGQHGLYSQQHIQGGIAGTYGMQNHIPYYTSTVPSTTNEARTGPSVGLSVNPSLNMSPSRWRVANSSNTTDAPAVHHGRQNRAFSVGHVQGLTQQRATTSLWTTNGL